MKEPMKCGGRVYLLSNFERLTEILMPDERDPGFVPELPESEVPDDEDIPFRLPLSSDLDDTDLEETEAEPNSSDVWDSANPVDAGNMPTMPIPLEPGTPDPRKTLPGSGGMDPNPDF